MAGRQCKICGADLPLGRSMYCSDKCAYEAEKRRSRERFTPKAPDRPGVYRERTCIDCGISFYGHIRSTRCPECTLKRKKEADRAYKERKKLHQTRLIGSTDRCMICGKPYVVKSSLQRYCSDCSPAAIKEHNNEKSRKWNREHYSDPQVRAELNERRRMDKPIMRVCIVCGKEFVADNTQQKICSDECRRVRERETWRESRERKKKKIKSSDTSESTALK